MGGFDADARAKRREESRIKIGGVHFHRRTKDHELSRKVRDLSLQQERLNGRIESLAKDADDEESQDAREAIEDEIRGLGDQSIDLSYAIVQCLLADDDGNEPTEDFLRKNLDQFEDLAPLTRLLVGGREQPEGPTQTTDS